MNNAVKVLGVVIGAFNENWQDGKHPQSGVRKFFCCSRCLTFQDIGLSPVVHVPPRVQDRPRCCRCGLVLKSQDE